MIIVLIFTHLSSVQQNQYLKNINNKKQLNFNYYLLGGLINGKRYEKLQGERVHL